MNLNPKDDTTELIDARGFSVQECHSERSEESESLSAFVHKV